MEWIAWIIGAGALVQGGLFLFGYMHQQIFPRPLSPEEERRYLEAWRQGDTSAREKLIEHNLRLVAHVVRKYENSGENPEDLISIGSIGLIKAVNTFNSQQGFKLVTYAAKCIENEILMYLRSAKKHKQEVSLYEPIGYDKDGSEVSLQDVLKAPGELSEEVEARLNRENLREKMQHLTPQERLVLTLRYGIRDGVRETQRTIAARLGISRSYVSRRA